MTNSRKYIFGNWKMAQTLASANGFFKAWNLEARPEVTLAVFPSFVHLWPCRLALETRKLHIDLGAQDISTEIQGAFTGEIAGTMLKELGCSFVLVGHSERRKRAHETNESLKKKLIQAEYAGLTPVFCIGETEAERDAGQVESVLSEQLKAISEFKKLFVVAYEPVWAIGTGRTAQKDEIESVHSFLRKKLSVDIPLLYGGSVNTKNARDILKMANVDGVLVGGASVKPEDFKLIVEAAWG